MGVGPTVARGEGLGIGTAVVPDASITAAVSLGAATAVSFGAATAVSLVAAKAVSLGSA